MATVSSNGTDAVDQQSKKPVLKFVNTSETISSSSSTSDDEDVFAKAKDTARPKPRVAATSRNRKLPQKLPQTLHTPQPSKPNQPKVQYTTTRSGRRVKRIVDDGEGGEEGSDSDIEIVAVEPAKKSPGKRKVSDADDIFATPDVDVEHLETRYNAKPKNLSSKLAKAVGGCDDDEIEVVADMSTGDVALPEDNEIDVKFDIRGEQQRITMQKRASICSILPQLAEKLGTCDVSQIRIAYKNIPISFDSTPEQLKLDFFSVLDVFLAEQEAQANDGNQADPNAIKIKVRDASAPQKQQIIELKLNKFKPLAELMALYANQVGKDVARMKFEFDGEILSGQDTPLDLDMEDDSLIDVRFKSR